MTTTSCSWALMEAVRTTLAADAELMGMVVAVYTHQPENVAYPFVIISPDNIEAWFTLASQGVDIMLEVEAVTRDRTPETILTILARIKELLHGVELSLSGGDLKSIRFISNTIQRNIDTLGYNGGVRFRALVAEG